LSVEVLADALQAAAIEGREIVIAELPDIHRRYVRAVAVPSAQALAPAALAPIAREAEISRAARPS
jgi:hypothetical protein